MLQASLSVQLVSKPVQTVNLVWLQFIVDASIFPSSRHPYSATTV